MAKNGEIKKPRKDDNYQVNLSEMRDAEDDTDDNDEDADEN
jgi:hypothetical protein